ncbi:MAG: hypothetical protein KGJ77_02520 [Acidobacteriota bacterium]|nr:hypothetical protein [Acidobacteriota bacterium]
MGRPASAFAPAAAAGLVCAVLALGPARPVQAAAGAASASTGRNAPTLELLSQTPWVGPGQPMTLHLGVGSAPRASLTVGLTLFQHLTTRSGFADTENGTEVGQVQWSTSVGVAALPADPQGGVDVVMPVSSGDAPAPPGPLTANLGCSLGNCGGVYPLRVDLASAGGASRAVFTTYLVYASPPTATQKLRFSFVVGVAAPAATAAGVPVGAPLPADQTDGLSSVLSVLAAHGTTPVTVAPQPATVRALGATPTPKARSVLAALGSLGTGGGHEVLATSYVPVDAAGLVDSGLGGELADQVRRAQQVLGAMRPSTDTWLAAGPVDGGTVSQLAGLGFRQLVVPPSAVGQAFGGGPGLTVSRPFPLGAGRGQTVPVVETDSGLAGDLAGDSGPAPALAAYRLLADLALLYYEEPNASVPRGAVALAGDPTTTAPGPAFLSIVLDALATDPVVAPVTLDGLFGAVPAATSPVRRAVATSGTTTLPVRQLRAARARLSAFASATGPGGSAVVRQLGDQLLLAENGALRAGQAQGALAAFDAALKGQLSTLSIRTDTIRLTSTAAKVPITVVKQSGYALSGTLEVSGDKVVFPRGASQATGTVCREPTVTSTAGRSSFACLASIAYPTNTVYIDMRARATGDFRLTVSLTSPTGHLVLASSDITVHSMSTSLVAVGLSVAAGAVLLVWWGRTLWRRRPAQGAHARGRSEGGAGRNR